MAVRILMDLPIQSVDALRAAGCLAATMGQGAETNPYPHDSFHSREWMEGYTGVIRLAPGYVGIDRAAGGDVTIVQCINVDPRADQVLMLQAMTHVPASMLGRGI